MFSAAAPSTTPYRSSMSRLVRAGLLTGVTDGLFSSILSVAFYHSTVERLFQGVASTLLGPEAFNGGVRTAAVGVFMHFGVAFTWSAVFLFFVARSPWIRGVLATPRGTLKTASLYGPFVWLVMSLVVIPLLLHRPPNINVRWWVQLLGHIPFVGLPIVASMAGTSPRQSGSG
jgi:uncharacterized membrane protein YagU involved in acid resistance